MRNRAFWSLVSLALACPLLLLVTQGSSLLLGVWLGVEALALGLVGWFPHDRGPTRWQRWALRGLFVVLSLAAIASGAWSDRRAVQREQLLSERVSEVSEEARPVSLMEPRVQTQKDGEFQATRLSFPRSKNEALGELAFRAEVVAGDLRILSFGPPGGSGFMSRGKWRGLGDDGRSAWVQYSIVGAVDPVLLLTASGSGSVRIAGNLLPGAYDVTLP